MPSHKPTWTVASTSPRRHSRHRSNNASIRIRDDRTPQTGTLTTDKSVTSVTTASGASATATDGGDIITYSYLVTNTGNVTLTNVVPSDTGPTFNGTAGTATLSAFVPASATLAPGASQTFTATYTLSQTDVNRAVGITNGVANSATSSGVMPHGTTVTSPSDTAQTTIANASAMTLVKAGTLNNGGDGRADAGDTISYAFTITNTGNTTLTGINVTDALAGVTVSGGPITLAPGASNSTSIVAVYTLTQADIDAGQVLNNATASGKDPRGNDVTGADTETVTLPPLPALTVDKTTTSSSYQTVGDVLTYSYLVRNTGNTTLAGPITVADDVVNGAGGSVSCPAGSLAPAATLTCSATYTVTQADIDAGDVTNIASATSGSTTSPTDQVMVPAVKTPELTMVKQATSVTFTLPGDTVSYSYVVTNTGNTTITAPITVSDNFIPSVTCPPLPGGILSPGSTLTCTGIYTVTQDDLDIGSVTNIATATDGTTTSQPTSETIPASAQPALTIVKTPTTPTFDSVGDLVSYQFDVTNSGNVTLTSGINVTDDKIGTFSCITGNFIPGATQSCTASYTVTQADLDRGFVENTAFAATTYGIQLPPTPVVSAPDDAIVNATANPQITLTKSAATLPVTAVGQVLTYTFSVENTGNQTVSNIVVTDPLIPAVNCTIATLAPAATDATCTGTYTVKQSDVDAGAIANTALASGSSPQGNPVTDDDTLVTPMPAALPSLTITKTPSLTSFDTPGDVIGYVFAVTNTGNVTLSNITVTDPLIPALSCSIASLAPGATNSTCSGTYATNQTDLNNGSVPNTATASGTDPFGTTVNDTGNATVPADQSPSLVLSKTGTLDDGGDGRADAGDTINYSFTVRNTGNVNLTNVSISDPLVTVVGGPVANLAPGVTDSLTFTATYILTQADVNAGSRVNTATAKGTPPSGPDVTNPSTETTPLSSSPGIALAKTGTLDDGGDGRADAGDTINYTFSVENTGNVTLTNVTVSDPGVVLSGGPIASLLPGATDAITYTATHVLTQADINAGTYNNTASVTGSPPSGANVSDTDSAITPLSSSPAIALNKVGTLLDGGDGHADVGDTISYAFTVQNTGNVTLTNITVADPLVTVSGGPLLSLAPGGTDNTTFTASYILTQADINSGTVANTASVTGTPPTGPDVVGPANTNTTIPPVASIALIKDSVLNDGGDGRADVGDTVNYSFTVTNTGNVTLTAVNVTDPLVTVSGGPIASLAPGASDSSTFTATYVLTQADINAGSRPNTATAVGTPPVGGPVTGDGSKTTVLPTDPKLALSKNGVLNDGGDGRADAGDTINYTFTVENTGNVTLSNITITDPLVTVIGGPIATLLPGATDAATFTASYTLTQADVNTGSVVNNASVSGSPPTGPNVTAPATNTTPLAGAPAMTLSKSGTLNDGGDGRADVGDTISYTFTVENTGNVTLSNITVTDPLVTVTGGPIATLLPGATDAATFTATYTLTQADVNAGSVVNNASASGSPPTGPAVTAPATETTPLPPVSSMTLAKAGTLNDGGDGRADVGDTISYAFTVENTGNVTLSNVTISDPLVTVAGGPLASLAPGAVDNTTFTATYVLTQADINAGSRPNTATVSANPPTGPPTSATGNESTPLPAAPSIELTKSGTAVVGGDGIADAGDTITYTFTVRNTGNVTLTNVTVTDPLVTIVGGPIASLAPGATDAATFQASYVLTQADVNAGTVANTASVSGNPPTGPPATDDGTANTPLPAVPELSLVKTGTLDDGGDGVANAGDVINYTFAVTNTGNVTLTNVTLADPLVSVIGGPIATLAPDEVDSSTFTASYVLTQADVNAGTVPNTATVSGKPPIGPDITADGTSSTSLAPVPQLTLSKSGTLNDGGDGVANIGDTISYTFTVENTGNVTLSNVTVTDPLVTVTGGPIASLTPAQLMQSHSQRPTLLLLRT